MCSHLKLGQHKADSAWRQRDDGGRKLLWYFVCEIYHLVMLKVQNEYMACPHGG